MTDLDALARQVIDANAYLVLGTADAAGNPWATPVFFAHRDYTDFFWVSAAARRHSENVDARRRVSFVVFDSSVPVGGGPEAVYVEAEAERAPVEEFDAALALFAAKLAGRSRVDAEDIGPDGLFTLYWARASEHSVLIRGGDPEYGRGADSRRVVHPAGR